MGAGWMPVIFHDNVAQTVGEKLRAREEHREIKGKGWPEGSGQSRRCWELREMKHVRLPTRHRDR